MDEIWQAYCFHGNHFGKNHAVIVDEGAVIVTLLYGVSPHTVRVDQDTVVIILLYRVSPHAVRLMRVL